MTNREVIELLETIKLRIDLDSLEDSEDAIDMGIQALKKQEPKKPIKEGAFYHTYNCSKCGNSVSDDETYAYNYCPNCGQTIDWRE